MIVLHAAFRPDGLWVWAERPAEAGAEATAPRSPYDGGEAAIRQALAAAGLGRRIHMEDVLGWLPTAGGAPLASSPLIADPPSAKGRPKLVPWMLTAAALTTANAVDLLAACIGEAALAPGVFTGRDLAYAASVLQLAAGLVARQRFLPGLRQTDGIARAVWVPILDGPEAERMAHVARSMPDAARALEPAGDGAHPPETAPLSLVRAFVDAAVDHLVRTSASGDDVARVSLPIHSIHEQWMDALRSADGTLDVTAAELARLAGEVREWHRPVTSVAAAPFRLTFRLEEPAVTEDEDEDDDEDIGAEAGSGPWRVRYLLQAARDPSLLVPAEDVWTDRARRVLKHEGFDAKTHLLGSLGQASRLEARIEKSLGHRAPTGYETDARGAFEFLSRSSIELEQAGFGVLLPAWWTRTGTRGRLGVKATVSSPKLKSESGVGLDELVKFDWQVALGDKTLTRAELQELVRLKVPLVRVRGQWVHVNAAEIQAALRFWKEKGKTASVRDVVRLTLGVPGMTAGLPFEGVEATGWVGDLVRTLEGHAAFEERSAPEGFQGTLRPYQLRGYSWLDFLAECGFGACLADDMGLGKTVQALALIQKRWRDESRRPTLLICPTSVVGNWEKEAARFTPDLPVLIHHGAGRARSTLQKEARGKALVISSYALLHRDLEALRAVDWSAVVLDEAQNIKNAETKQARAARALPAARRIALTGTPVENHVGDLWSLMEFLNPSFLGNQAEFKRTFFVPIQAGRDASAAARLKRLTSPFILRRLKTDRSIIADLPEKMEMKVFCTLTREQASLYEAVVAQAAETLKGAPTEGIERKGVILATLSKLKQVCNHPAQFLHDNSPLPGRSGKLARLTEMLDEVLEAGDRALVFSQFAEMGTMLRRHLMETFGREVLFLHGGVSKKQRDEMVERFQAGGAPIFILSLKAGGTGLNLTGASHVFHFDRWWNPAVEDQATDRAFRIGQTRNVQVHKFLCAGTLEEKIDEMIEKKKTVAEQVVGAGEGWLTELSTEDLRELMALRPGAVAE
jgi:SNF2 family DNA or RNA helicase